MLLLVAIISSHLEKKVTHTEETRPENLEKWGGDCQFPAPSYVL